VLEIITENLSGTEVSVGVSGPIQQQIQTIVYNCNEVMEEILQMISKYSSRGRMGPVTWSFDGERQAMGLYRNLKAHRGALELILSVFSM
jgi:hypothetical protein